MTEIPIMMASLCEKHAYLLVHQAGYAESDPWRALIVAAQLTLFQAATCDPRIHQKLGGDVARFHELGCLACEKPDAFGEIVREASAPDRDLGRIKRLGDAWVAASARPPQAS